MTSSPVELAEPAAESDDEPVVVPLLAPRDGTPPVLTTNAELAEVIASFAAGTGPVAVDAERASGYRYSQRAYLVQLRRAGAGSALIDPIALPDLKPLSGALAGVEWVFHAASQDLACLAEVGLVPDRIFDTELAGRLLGYERVGLGRMVAEVLGFALEKGHSAADWSTRPLPEDWLVYAALDVELLVELRDVLAGELAETGKSEWAQQEFAAVLAAPPPPPRIDPWRRLSGIHRLRTRRQLAVAKSLWEARDAAARRRDIAPGRVLPDAAVLAAVTAEPQSADELAQLPVFAGPRQRRAAGTWWSAIVAGRSLPEDRLPAMVAGGGPDGTPTSGSRWADRDPAAAVRLAVVRGALAAAAAEAALPVENVLEPALARRLAWAPPSPVTVESIEAVLAAGGARPWQIEQTAVGLAEALAPAPAPDVGSEAGLTRAAVSLGAVLPEPPVARPVA